jgi:2,4-dienoyl-CoA reductase-like NADH-dependent reductase (Old Yellow Enzyme family)
MTSLFEPLTLRGLTVPNRVWMPPMCQYSAEAEGPLTGVPTDWHFQHLASRAAGGAGLIILEATGVSAEGRISPFDLGLWNDAQQEAFRRITAFLESQGAVPGIQLGHAGRKASTDAPWRGGGALRPEEGGWTPVAPSAIPFDDASPVPAELSTEEIAEVVRQFADAARRALAAGFKTVELHGAHGYLIHQFLSPASNHRTDAYGGPLENRMRFALEVATAVREVWPDELPLLFRLSATDWLENDEDADTPGWTVEDSVRLAKELQAVGVDLIDVSTGGNIPRPRIPVGPGYQVPFAERLRREAGIRTAAVGLITEAEQAQRILDEERADAVLIGRELLRSPYWPRRAAELLGGGDGVTTPPQYARAYR